MAVCRVSAKSPTSRKGREKWGNPAGIKLRYKPGQTGLTPFFSANNGVSPVCPRFIRLSPVYRPRFIPVPGLSPPVYPRFIVVPGLSSPVYPPGLSPRPRFIPVPGLSQYVDIVCSQLSDIGGTT